MKFRKKPVVIDAWLFDGKPAGAAIEDMAQGKVRMSFEPSKYFLRVETLEGSMRADEGDYIIKGIKGEFYPCKPDIFEASYELAE